MKRFSVRLYVSKNAKGRCVGGTIDQNGNRHPIYSRLTQITYKADTVSEALYQGFRYLGKNNPITSYTVTDRQRGGKFNVKVG